MLIDIGPVPASSAKAYVALCRERLPALGEDEILDAILTPYVREQFGAFLDDWERAADKGEVFHWTAELDPEMVEHVFFAFFQCVRRTYVVFDREDPELVELRTPFRVALTNAVLDALEAEGKGSSQLATTLRESWPDPDIG